jgi:hypothetical protein
LSAGHSSAWEVVQVGFIVSFIEVDTLFPNKFAGPAVLIKTFSFFDGNCCFDQGRNIGHLHVVSARSMWSCNVMCGVSEKLITQCVTFFLSALKAI